MQSRLQKEDEERLLAYCDAQTGLMALRPGTFGRTEDNHLLFAATAAVMFGFKKNEFLKLIEPFRLAPGVFTRYPGDPQPSSWDDHLGLACAHPSLALEIYLHAQSSNWTWGDKWLGRLPLFVTTVKACAGVRLNWFEQLLAAGCFIENALKPRGSSGSCLLLLSSYYIRTQSKVLKWVVSIWVLAMRIRYPRGVRDLYRVYFGVNHPFTELGQKDWDLYEYRDSK